MNDDWWTGGVQPQVASGTLKLNTSDLPDFCREGCYWQDCGHERRWTDQTAEHPTTPFLARYASPRLPATYAFGWVGSQNFGVLSRQAATEAADLILATMGSYPFDRTELLARAREISVAHIFDPIEAMKLIERCWIAADIQPDQVTEAERRKRADIHVAALKDRGGRYADMMEYTAAALRLRGGGWRYDPGPNYFVRDHVGSQEIALPETVERDPSWGAQIDLPPHVVRWLLDHPTPGAYR